MSHRDDVAKNRDASPASGDESAELGDAKDKTREKSKVKGKIIRVLTVLAYVLSVSLAAIMLSLYYVFLWDPKMPGGTGPVGRLEADGPEPRYAMHSAAADSVDLSASPIALLSSATATAVTTAEAPSAHALNAPDDDAGLTQLLANTGV